MIGREEAIKNLSEWLTLAEERGSYYGEEAIQTYKLAIEVLSHERPKGRWEEVWRGDYIATLKCSVCGRRINIDPANNEKEILRQYPYCHCGADMRGEEECI